MMQPTITERKCWEIYVPTMTNSSNPKPIKRRQHKEWDRRIMRVAGGLTVLMAVKGKWINPDKKLFDERMIPVRIVATEDEIKKIIAITLEFYNQEAVLCYMVSDKVMLVYKTQLN